MSITINFDEKDIEDFLCTEDHLEKYLGLKYVNRQVNIDKFFIDILAYSPREKCFYIIELKKDELNAKAFVQALKYHKLMSYAYKHKHKFKVLLIGKNLNEDLHYLTTLFDYPPNKRDFLYILYSYTFENGIAFNTYNIAQAEIQEHLEENYYV